jgi:predicted NUDIX family phosphoesterase
MGEMVLVVRSEKIDGTGLFKMPLSKLNNLVKRYGMFIKYKQIIHYVVLKDGEDFIVYKRTNKQSEDRLHNKYSLGVGGHINLEDKAPTALGTILNGMLRELSEEFDVVLHDFKYVGLLNYEGSSVSEVHLGVIFIADIDYVGVKELDKFEVYFSKDLDEYMNEFEDWSFIIAQAIKKGQLQI